MADTPRPLMQQLAEGDLMACISIRIPKEIPVYEAINVFYSSNKHDVLLNTTQTALRSWPLELSDEALKKENNFLAQEMFVLRDPRLQRQ